MSKELTYAQASKRLKELQYAKAQMGQLSINDEIHKKALEISLTILGQKEQGECEWIELECGAIPVHPDTMVEVKMRNGATDGPREASRFFWYRGNETRDEMGCDIIAYRTIPERDTNQSGDGA